MIALDIGILFTSVVISGKVRKLFDNIFTSTAVRFIWVEIAKH